MNIFHDVNKLYDGTLTKIHNFFNRTDMTTHGTFTFSEAKKQEDIISFLDAMEK